MQPECKLIIFDLDGVLIDAKEIHFNALNKALSDYDSKFMISKDEHIAKFDGLPTKEKLKILEREKGLNSDYFLSIEFKKQQYTKEELSKIEPNEEIVNLIKRLILDGFKIAVCSNSITSTVWVALQRIGIAGYVDGYIGNDDVKNPKPNPEMYLRTMANFGVAPSETLIVEDSEVGRKAALASGANLCPVDFIEDVTYDLISRYAGSISSKPNKWKDDKLNILIPMAGLGSRFETAGYSFPKPLIEVRGKPMIQVVVENLNIDAKYTFIVRKEHYYKYSLKYLLGNIAPRCNIVTVDQITEGAAMTTLLAEKYINNDDPLLIANSDQFLEWDSSSFMYYAISKKLTGCLPVFEATHPKWSFVTIDQQSFVTKVVEKIPVSNLATAGIYYWKHGSEYVKSTYSMCDKDIRTNGEFYIAPVYNEIIRPDPYLMHRKCVGIYKFNKMWGLGTPEDLQIFLNNYEGEV